MRHVVFGQTAEMARDFAQTVHAQRVRVITSDQDLLGERDLTVYLAGDWELNEYWPSVLSELRLRAKVYVVKMFIASEVV